MAGENVPDQAVAAAAKDAATVLQRYCYHCQTYHPIDEMRRMMTRSGPRWRCLRSIAAARQNAEARQAYGRATSAANRLANQRRAESLNRQRRERMGGALTGDKPAP